VSALAGMGGMSLGTYASLAGLSLFARLLVIYAFGEALREPIEWLLAVIDAYWVQITVAMVLGVLVYQRWRSRRSRGDGDQPLQST
jgi:membrane protein DedA with SNARE-associated domain